MASGRDAVRMSEPEIEDFLAAHRKAQVATVGRDGRPHLTTLFYVVQDGRIAFWTYGRSQKIANLRRDDRVTVLVEDGEDYFELRGVSVTGRARLVESYAEVRALGAAVTRMLAGGADLGELGDDIVDQQARKRVVVVIEPEKVTSWDHTKMSALPGQGS